MILSQTNAHTPAAAVKVCLQNLFPFILGVDLLVFCQRVLKYVQLGALDI